MTSHCKRQSWDLSLDSLTPSFIHAFGKFIMGTHCAPDITLGPEDRAVDPGKPLSSCAIHSSGRRDSKRLSACSEIRLWSVTLNLPWHERQANGKETKDDICVSFSYLGGLLEEWTWGVYLRKAEIAEKVVQASTGSMWWSRRGIKGQPALRNLGPRAALWGKWRSSLLPGQ